MTSPKVSKHKELKADVAATARKYRLASRAVTMAQEMHHTFDQLLFSTALQNVNTTQKLVTIAHQRNEIERKKCICRASTTIYRRCQHTLS